MYKSGSPAKEDVKCGELLVGKEILPRESWSNRTHLHKHCSVLTDMCFINNLRLNSDISCSVPIPHVSSSNPPATSTYWLLSWINCWLLLPSKADWALIILNGTKLNWLCSVCSDKTCLYKCCSAGLLQPEPWDGGGQRSLGSSGSALCSGLIWD